MFLDEEYTWPNNVAKTRLLENESENTEHKGRSSDDDGVTLKPSNTRDTRETRLREIAIRQEPNRHQTHCKAGTKINEKFFLYRHNASFSSVHRTNPSEEQDRTGTWMGR